MKAEIFDAASFWDDFSWEQARVLVAGGAEEMESLLPTARQRTVDAFGPAIKLFQPGSSFPAISITGSECALDCLHCNKRYLKQMKHATTPEDLLALCHRLDDRGAVGCLISGGCNPEGSVPLGPFLDAIATIKQETHLVLNLHTGFLTPEVAARLGEIGVDVVSFDVNGSSETVREIYRLDRDIGDYQQSLDLLAEYGVNFVPHVCIGLHYGQLKGELDALELIAKYDPSTIVFIILIPPTDGPNRGLFATPTPDDVGKIFCTARAALPHTELFLGCMRPGGVVRSAIERRAIEAGASTIVIPTRETREWLAAQEIPIRTYNSCCAIPPDLYEKALAFH
ncbi:MAG TPA: radical SAM protein [Candidatus Lokiarchaeia archaeon]|nr:radical SAM protein [Candidatus Lokiarchaeia archaeon]